LQLEDGKEMTHARRVDNEHAKIRDTLRASGYCVIDTHALGFGFPDLLVVGKCGLVVLMEIKTPGEKLDAAEIKFHAAYTGRICIVYSVDEAQEVMYAFDKEAGE